MATQSHFVYKFFIFFSLFSIFSVAHLQSNEDGFISVAISDKGLEFVKDLLIDTAVSSLTPLELPPIEKYIKIAFVGRVHVVLSNIIIYHIDIDSSKIDLGDDGIAISSKAMANISMDWKYTYQNWFIEVSDKGEAAVQVKDMGVGLSVNLKDQGGKLELSLLDSSCDVEDIDIELYGGASWLYQGLVDAFSDHIKLAVQKAILKKLNVEISKIGSLLQSLPTEVIVDEVSALNVTVVSDPILSDSSIRFLINGLFIPIHMPLVSRNLGQISQVDAPCSEAAKMIAISLREDVFRSALLVYYDAGLMYWMVDKMPDQSVLKTNSWKDVVPQLYEHFPNDSMVLNVSVSSPPSVHISNDKIGATAEADIIVDVLNGEDVVPVASLSLVINASGSAEISGNNLTGSVKLDYFSLSSKWSKVGNLEIDVLQPLISEIIEYVLLPPLNKHLTGGFPLPLIRGFTLQDAKVVYADSAITVCSDVAFAYDKHLPDLYSIINAFGFHLAV